MKSKRCLNLLLVCIVIIPLYDYCKGKQSDEWQDKPLFKKAESMQQPEEELQDSANDNNQARKAVWYKKSSVKYAAASLFSAAVTAYSLYRYLQAPQVAQLETETPGIGTENNNAAIVETHVPDLTPPVQKTVTGTPQEEKLTVDEGKLSAAKTVAGLVFVGVGSLVLAGITYVLQNGFPPISFP